MEITDSIILGLVQGITEFLPVSSSGHLVITQSLLGFSHPPFLFDILIHVATLSAVLVYFRKRIVSYLSLKNLKSIIIASIPAGLFGVFLSTKADTLFASTMLAGVGLLITGTLMVLTKKIKKHKIDTITPKKAINIGMFQALALLPGISRSGSTIFGSLINKVSKEKAFEFSFILSIPAILGALLLQLVSTNNTIITTPDIVGFITAFLSGLIAIRVLDIIIHNDKLHLFGYYCLLLGTLVLSFSI